MLEPAQQSVEQRVPAMVAVGRPCGTAGAWLPDQADVDAVMPVTVSAHRAVVPEVDLTADGLVVYGAVHCSPFRLQVPRSVAHNLAISPVEFLATWDAVPEPIDPLIDVEVDVIQFHPPASRV